MTRLIALLVLGLLVVVGAAGIDAAHQQAGEQFQHNESFSPDAGNVTVLDNSNLDGVVYDARVTVKDSNQQKMVSGEDYEWLKTNGTVKTVSGGRLDGESSATINYGYGAPTETQTNIATLMSGLFEVQSVLLMVLVVGLLLSGMRVLGGL